VHSKTPSDLPPLLLKRDDQNCLLANKALQGFAQAYRSMDGDSSNFFAVELRIGNTGTHSLAVQISDVRLLKKKVSGNSSGVDLRSCGCSPALKAPEGRSRF
jgi:hypothetical protein